MLTEKDILDALDNSNRQSAYSHFISLGDVYSYLADCRLNIFKGTCDRWAIAAERLGFNPRADCIVLDISYYGNCLINLEYCNGQPENSYRVLPVDYETFNKTIENEVLKPDAKFWLVRGRQIELSHNKREYIDAGVELKEYEPNGISAEEVARLAVIKHKDLLRATNDELYKSIPADLKKIFVLDEWYHKDYIEALHPNTTDEHLRATYELNKNLVGRQEYMDYETFAFLFRQREQSNDEFNQQEWQDNRPSSYETWQQIARVVVTGDTSHYKPTLQPNTNWKYWLNSGTF